MPRFGEGKFLSFPLLVRHIYAYSSRLSLFLPIAMSIQPVRVVVLEASLSFTAIGAQNLLGNADLKFDQSILPGLDDIVSLRSLLFCSRGSRE